MTFHVITDTIPGSLTPIIIILGRAYSLDTSRLPRSV